MASTCSERNGNKRIAFVDPEGRHRSLRLGKCQLKVAETTRTRIEQLVRRQAHNLRTCFQKIVRRAGEHQVAYKTA